MTTAEADYRAVWRDFDVDLAEPGTASGVQLDALLADLGVTTVSGMWGKWVARLDAAGTAGVPALTGRLAHPNESLRRIVAFSLSYLDCPDKEIVPELLRCELGETDDAARIAVLAALSRYAAVNTDAREYLRQRLADSSDPTGRFGAAFGLALHHDGSITDEELIVAALQSGCGDTGYALTDLPWCDPEWESPVERIIGVTDWSPTRQFYLLIRITPLVWQGSLGESAAKTLVEAADRLYRKNNVEYDNLAALIAGLLRHPDKKIRSAAATTHNLAGNNSYAAALAAALTRKDIPGTALAELVRHASPLAVEPLRERIRGGLSTEVDATFLETLLSYADRRYADELLPAVVCRLTMELSASELKAILGGIARWGPAIRAALPAVMTALDQAYRRIDGLDYPDHGDLDALAACCSYLRHYGLDKANVVARLRQIAVSGDLEARLIAIRARMGLGEQADDLVVGLLLGVLADQPYRSGRPGRLAGSRGWRFDDNACAWLGELGPRAEAAVPALRAMLIEQSPACATAAYVLWRITGDSSETLPILDRIAAEHGEQASAAQSNADWIRASGTQPGDG